MALFGLGFLLGLLAALLPQLVTRRIHPLAGQALLVHGAGAFPLVRMTPTLIFPFRHRTEMLDISQRALTVKLIGPRGVSCKDNIRADVTATFRIRILPCAEDILSAVRLFGVARASDPVFLAERFTGRFEESIQAAFRQWEFEELTEHMTKIREDILGGIGLDLDGFHLDDLDLQYLQTPLACLDRLHAQDAEGIRKIEARLALERS